MTKLTRTEGYKSENVSQITSSIKLQYSLIESPRSSGELHGKMKRIRHVMCNRVLGTL